MQITHYPPEAKPRRKGDVREFTEPQFQYASRQQRVNSAFAYAKYAARMCARQIFDNNLSLDSIDIMARMATYQVNKFLREYATKLTFEYAKKLRERAK